MSALPRRRVCIVVLFLLLLSFLLPLFLGTALAWTGGSGSGNHPRELLIAKGGGGGGANISDAKKRRVTIRFMVDQD